MQRKHSESSFYETLGTFWEPMVDQNGFLMEPIFTLLPDNIEASYSCERSVTIELPSTSNGMRRFLHGNLAQGKTDLVLTNCRATTTDTLICHLGTVRVPRQYNKNTIYDALM